MRQSASDLIIEEEAIGPRVLSSLAHWRKVLQGDVPVARQILTKLLCSKISIEPWGQGSSSGLTGTSRRYFWVPFHPASSGRPMFQAQNPLAQWLVPPMGFEPTISALKGQRPNR